MHLINKFIPVVSAFYCIYIGLVCLDDLISYGGWKFHNPPLKISCIRT